MKKQYISLLLHAYQPPTQTETMLQKIYRECYEPLISLLEKEPNVFFSMDMAKSLGERLPEEFLGRIKKLYKNNRLELLNTFAYHYLGPLTPREYILRQLSENEKFYREQFIGKANLPGVFPPEMAFTPEMANIFHDANHDWCITDDEPFVRMRHSLPGEKQAPYDWVPQVGGKNGCAVFLRSGMRSKEIAFSKYQNGREFADILIDSMKDWGCTLGKEEGYIILAMDAETFGHHLPGTIQRMLLAFANRIKERSSEAEIVPMDFLYRHFEKNSTYVPKGSWSTGDSDYPYPLWNHPENPFHKAWNEFLEIAYSLSLDTNEDKDLERLYDTSFYSCTPWQYSMNNKNIARWCLFNFSQIIGKTKKDFEKTRMKELLDEMDRLTR